MGVINSNKLDLITYNDETIKLGELDEFLIRGIIDCIYTKENFLICYPNKKMFLPLVISAVLRNEIQNYKFSSVPTKRTTILLIADKKHSLEILTRTMVYVNSWFNICNEQYRYFNSKGIFCNIDDPYFSRIYWRHILNRYFNSDIPESVPLHYLLPISTGYHSFQAISRGERNNIGRKDNVQSPVFLVTENIGILKNKDIKYDYCFIDGSFTSKTFAAPSQGTLMFFDNPLDDRILYAQRSNPKNLIIDGKTLLNRKEEDHFKLGNQVISLKKLLLTTNITGLEVKYIRAKFEIQLEKAFQLLLSLKRKRFDSYDLNILSNLLYNIIRMPIEGTKFDEISSYQLQFDSINSLIKELKESDNRYEDDDFEAIIKLIEDIFYKYELDTYCPKFEELKDTIIREVDKNRSVAIVSSNKVCSIALKEKLALTLRVNIDGLEGLGINFYNKKQVLKNRTKIYDHTLIMFSAMNLQDLRVMTQATSKKFYMLLYNLEINEIKKKLEKMTLIDNSEDNGRYYNSRNTLYQYILNRLVSISDLIYLDEGILMEDIIAQTDKVNVPYLRTQREYNGEKVASAKLVTFDNNGCLFMRLKSKVNYIDRKNRKLGKKSLEELKIGDEILFIENDARQDIYKLFINSIEGEDEIVKNFSLIERWRDIYEDKFISYKLTNEELFHRMQRAGWDKKTRGILANWRSGYSYGPRDKKDIEILGEVLNIRDFIENPNVYFDAMTRIRVEKRKAARILNKIIYYANRKFEDEELKVLEKYNLNVEMLREAVKVKKIQAISTENYKVKPTEIGHFYHIDRD